MPFSRNLAGRLAQLTRGRPAPLAQTTAAVGQNTASSQLAMTQAVSNGGGFRKSVV